MIHIGLTGGIGSGKSFVADQFASLGAAIVDSDLVAHAVTARGGAALPAIVARFGAAMIGADGAMDRAAMRRLVFADPRAKADLEAITHPLIRAACEAQAQAHEREGRAPYLIFVVPLLVESGNWKRRVDRVLVVDCPVAVQIDRVMRRNGLSRAEVEAIVRRQATREQRLAAADDVIDNSGAADAVAPQVHALHARYLDLSARS